MVLTARPWHKACYAAQRMLRARARAHLFRKKSFMFWIFLFLNVLYSRSKFLQRFLNKTHPMSGGTIALRTTQKEKCD